MALTFDNPTADHGAFELVETYRLLDCVFYVKARGVHHSLKVVWVHEDYGLFQFIIVLIWDCSESPFYSKLFELIQSVYFSNHTDTTHNGHVCIYDDHVYNCGLVLLIWVEGKEELQGMLSTLEALNITFVAWHFEL